VIGKLHAAIFHDLMRMAMAGIKICIGEPLTGFAMGAVKAIAIERISHQIAMPPRLSSAP
jgi:hypothetical protein